MKNHARYAGLSISCYIAIITSLHMTLPVALGDISSVTLAMTVTLNGICCDVPVNTNVAVNNPPDSSAEYLESLNPTQVTISKD